MAFSWKRKKNEIAKNELFNDEEETSNESFKRLKPTKIIQIEDATSKSLRLKNEGITLADNERHWEAIKKWEESIKLNPNDESIHEMMSQVYLMLNELLPALRCAEKCVRINSKWWIGHQTMGRALLGIGQVKLALKSFSKAIYLQPDVRELWEDDLKWTLSLLNRLKTIDSQNESINLKIE